MDYTALEELNGLSEEERKVAIKILNELSSGNDDLYDKLRYEDFDEIPVDINIFLHDKQYLGNALYDTEGRFTLFPYWEEKLKDIFPDNITTKYNTIIFTGAIGLGKSTIAVICLLYLLYRLLCLKDPYLYYGLQPIDKITISLMNITIENAKGVALDKLNQMILSSEWFMNHGKIAGITNLNYVPNKHIELITASGNNQVIGRAIFCLSGDTLVSTETGIYKLKDLIYKQTKFKTLNNDNYVSLSDFCTVMPTINTNEFIEITLADDTLLRCTKNHKFMLKDGTYKEAQFLTEDDELFDML